MLKTIDELKDLVKEGKELNFIICAKDYALPELMDFARINSLVGGSVEITDARTLSVNEMKEILRLGENIKFDLR